MARGGWIVVTGVKDIDRRFRKLETAVQGQILRAAVRRGLKPMVSEVKANVPVKSGASRRAVKIVVPKKKRRGVIAMDVRVVPIPSKTLKTSKAGRPFFYPAGVEYGDRENAPNPFMRRAYSSKGETVRRLIIQGIQQGIDGMVTKLRGK